MKVDEDGFKTPEPDDPVIPDVLYAIVENQTLLFMWMTEIKKAIQPCIHCKNLTAEVKWFDLAEEVKWFKTDEDEEDEE